MAAVATAVAKACFGVWLQHTREGLRNVSRARFTKRCEDA